MTARLLALVLMAGALACAQDVAPTDLVGVRVGYDASVSPTTSGGLIYAHKITGDKYPTYSYTQLNFTPLRQTPYIQMGTQETGIAQFVQKVGPFAIYAFGTGGLAQGGGNFGLSLSGGGMAIALLGRNVYSGPYARASKATISVPQYEVGVSLFYAFR